MEIIEHIIEKYNLEYNEEFQYWKIINEEDIIPIVDLLCENEFKISIDVLSPTINIKDTPIYFCYVGNKNLNLDFSKYNIYKVIMDCVDDKAEYNFGNVFIVNSGSNEPTINNIDKDICNALLTYDENKENIYIDKFSIIKIRDNDYNGNIINVYKSNDMYFTKLKDAKNYLKNSNNISTDLEKYKHKIKNIEQLQNYDETNKYVSIEYIENFGEFINISHILANPNIKKIFIGIDNFYIDDSIESNLTLTKFKIKPYARMNIHPLEIARILYRNKNLKINVKSARN